MICLVPFWVVCLVGCNWVQDSNVYQESLVEGVVGTCPASDLSTLFLDLALLEGSGIGRGVGSGMGIGVGSGIGIGVGSGIGRASVSFPLIPPSLRSVRVVASLSRISLEDWFVLASLLDGWGRKTLYPALSARSHASSY